MHCGVHIHASKYVCKWVWTGIDGQVNYKSHETWFMSVYYISFAYIFYVSTQVVEDSFSSNVNDNLCHNSCGVHTCYYKINT